MLLEKVKMALRIVTPAYDDEITRLIASALADLRLVGIITDESDPLIERAVITYCRVHFGSPGDYDRLKASYDEQKAQLQVASGYVVPMEVANGQRGCY